MTVTKDVKDVIAWMSGTIRKLEQRIKILEASLPRVIALDDLIPALHETEIQQTHATSQYVPEQDPTSQRPTVSFMNPVAEEFYPTGGGGMCSGSCDLGGSGIPSGLEDDVCIGTRDMGGGGGTNSGMDDGGMYSGSSDMGGGGTNSGMVDGGVCIGTRDMGGGGMGGGMAASPDSIHIHGKYITRRVAEDFFQVMVRSELTRAREDKNATYDHMDSLLRDVHLQLDNEEEDGCMEAMREYVSSTVDDDGNCSLSVEDFLMIALSNFRDAIRSR